MGTLYCGDTEAGIEVEDRALAHLKVVMTTKLRRSESFTLTWAHPDEQPAGRSVIWLSPSIPLRFVQDDPEPIELNRAWIEELARSASSSSGIILSPELFDGPAAEQPEQSVGDSFQKVEVAELTIGHLTVAGADESERAGGGAPRAEPKRSAPAR